MIARGLARFDQRKYERSLPALAAIKDDPGADRLANALALADSFQLDSVVCPAARDAEALLIWLALEVPERRGGELRLTRLVPERGADDVRLSPAALTTSILAQLESCCSDPLHRSMVVIDATGYRSDEHDAWRWLFQRWNERRNLVAAAVAAPLILLLPPELEVAFSADAPDVWSIRSVSVRLRGERVKLMHDGLTRAERFEPDALEHARAAVAALRAAGDAPDAVLVPALRKLAQLELAHGHVATAADIVRDQLGPLCAIIDDPVELAKIDRVEAGVLVARDRNGEALAILRDRVLPVIERDSAYQRVLTYRAIARALAGAGDLDGALRWLRDQALPLDKQTRADRGRAKTLGQIAEVLAVRGDLEEALAILREEVLPSYVWLGDRRSNAVTRSSIAEIVLARGQLAEAHRIWADEVLPVYERLGDVQSRAVAHAKIADVLCARGQLGEAVQRWRRDALPVFEQVGDLQSMAATLMRVADGLRALGALDDAFKLCRDDVLSLSARLGDTRLGARAQGSLAELARARGQTEAALAMLTEQVIPAYELLGEGQSVAATQLIVADLLSASGRTERALQIWQQQLLPSFERTGDLRGKATVQSRVADVLFEQDQIDNALEILRVDVLPVYERLGDIRAKAMTQGKLADMLFAQGRLDDALALRKKSLSVHERLGDMQSLSAGLLAYANMVVADPTASRIAELRARLHRARQIAAQLAAPFPDELGDLLAGLPAT